MNILLMCPEFPDACWSCKRALKLAHKSASSPPPDFLTVAGPAAPLWENRHIVFVSAMLVQREAARRVIRRWRQGGLKIIAGGPLFTSEHEQFDEVDHFVQNEGGRNLPPSPPDPRGDHLGDLRRPFPDHL